MPNADDSIELAPLAVELFVPDVAQAVRFYTEALGFHLHRTDPEGSDSPEFALTSLGSAVFMFMKETHYTGGREHLAADRGEGVDIRIVVDDVDAFYTRTREAGMLLLHVIGDREYGLRDFIVRDPFGFRLRFASPLR